MLALQLAQESFPLIPETDLRRFTSKVEPVGDCWVWTASQKAKGYGCFYWPGTRTQRAHRIAFIWANGPIDDQLVLDHICRNRLCVNPSHLEAVTTQENTRRGIGGPGLSKPWLQKDRCIRGHLFDAGNTTIRIVKGRPRRRCRECDRIFDGRRRLARQGTR